MTHHAITISIKIGHHSTTRYADTVAEARAIIADEVAQYEDEYRFHIDCYWTDAVQYDDFGAIIGGKVDLSACDDADASCDDTASCDDAEASCTDDVDEFGFTAEDRAELDDIFAADNACSDEDDFTAEDRARSERGGLVTPEFADELKKSAEDGTCHMLNNDVWQKMDDFDTVLRAAKHVGVIRHDDADELKKAAFKIFGFPRMLVKCADDTPYGGVLLQSLPSLTASACQWIGEIWATFPVLHAGYEAFRKQVADAAFDAY